MRLIGAGLPRTGTLTQKIALEMLGLAPCHHMVNVLADLSEVERWRQALDGQIRAAQILEGFPAVVDWPGSYYYQQLMDDFPDARVLLSVRDGDAWAKSMRQTIWGALYGDDLIHHMSWARRRIDPLWDRYSGLMQEMLTNSGLLNGEDTTDEWMRDAFHRYNYEVQAVVPAERLLVWTPADGWEPLCEFLELPMPDAPFPHVNDSKEFGERVIDGSLAAVEAYRAAGAAVTA
ncbi:MAG: sulfotransferase family protein [Dermatophilaceae bacterium]